MPWYSQGSKKHDAYYASMMHIMHHVLSHKTVNLTPFKLIKFEDIGYLYYIMLHDLNPSCMTHHASYPNSTVHHGLRISEYGCYFSENSAGEQNRHWASTN